MKKLVSTMNGEYIFDKNAIEEVFINQGTPNITDDFRWINTDTIGLSNSRNIALSTLYENQIGIISDNDVLLTCGYETYIQEAFNLFPDADVITFMAKQGDSNELMKSYRTMPFKHNLFSVMKVSSIEIVIRRSKSKEFPLFDINFGLGSTIPLGEENIFLSDCIKNGLNVYFYPRIISIHLDESHTGMKFTSITSLYRKKVFCRIYGELMGRMIYIAFLIKNRLKYSDGFLDSLKQAFN